MLFFFFIAIIFFGRCDSFFSFSTVMSSRNTIYDAAFKQQLLKTYAQSRPRLSLRSLAKRFNIKGGHQLLKTWLDVWDGTVHSLEHKTGQGRPSIMSKEEVKELIGDKLIVKNRLHDPVHYTSLYPSIPRKIGHGISLRTVQRYGHNQQRAKVKTIIKRTEGERKFMLHISSSLLCARVSI